MSTKPRILLVDDHEIVREGIRTLIARSGKDWEVCGQASNAGDALKLVETLRPDVLVMDITMPGMSGLEASQQISKMGLASRVLMFTMHEFDRLRIEVRDAGAHGYVLKSQAARDLIVAIQTLLDGGTFYGAPSSSEPTPHRNSNPQAGGLMLRALTPFRLSLRYYYA